MIVTLQQIKEKVQEQPQGGLTGFINNLTNTVQKNTQPKQQKTQIIPKANNPFTGKNILATAETKNTKI